MEQTLVESIIAQRIRESIAVKELLLDDQGYVGQMFEVGLLMADALRQGHKIFFFGNGGSAADSQHLAAEFTGRYLKERRPLPAIALSVNSSSLTAIGNDYSFDEIFARQLEALGARGDVAIGLTTSGNSNNVLCAMEVARRKGIISVGLTGQLGGHLKSAADYCLCVPSSATPRIQEAHIMTGHILCEIVENELF